LVSTVFSYSGYSGLYYDDGLTLNGGYLIREADENEKINGLKMGVSYLEKQASDESLDRPTLFQSGILEISGFYKGDYASYDDGFTTMNLDISMAGAGLNFHLKNLKFGYNYETFSSVSYNINGQDVEDLEVSGYRQIFSAGLSRDLYSSSVFNIKSFLDLNILSGEFELSMGNNSSEDSFKDIKAIILGLGFQKNNLVIQPTILIPEDDGDKEVSISLIYKI
jgi:hypothetical protein